MQNPSLYSQIQAQAQQPQFPEQEQLKCPRCDSANTKFCYYNNYNLSQPRHFCRSCKRYWTKGGALRNIPVGGGSRKNSKRSSSSTSSSAEADSAASKRPAVAASPPPPASKDEKSGDRDKAGEVFDALPLRGENFSGQFESLSFSSLLGTGGDQYVGLLDGLGPSGPGLEINGHFTETGSGPNANPALDIGGAAGEGDEFLNLQGGGGGGGGAGDGDGGCWGGGGGGGGGGDWPDLSIYTPSSNFQ